MIADQLKMAGFTNNDVSVLLPDKQGTKDFAHEQHTKAPEGAATGATGGAVLGGALGWMVERSRVSDHSSQRVLLWQRWRVRLAAQQWEALPGHSLAWAFQSMRRSDMRERSKT